jgi:peptidoglycan hydrolase-like protein with peptidoglycan-binding domain
VNFDDPALCQFGNNRPETLGWAVNTGYVPFSYKGTPFPQGVYRGTEPLWTDLLDAVVHLIEGGLHPGWNWGAEHRSNKNNGEFWSFHACGRALDLNAPANANNAGWRSGAHSVPRAAAALARARGFLCGGEWGDAMHFENHLTKAGVAKRLAEIGHHPPAAGGANKPNKAKPPQPRPPVKKGYPLPAGYYFGPLSGPKESISGMAPSGSDTKHRPHIKRIQRVVATPQDGLYGQNTINHVRGWQAAHHVAADGLTGPKTWHAMGL